MKKYLEDQLLDFSNPQRMPALLEHRFLVALRKKVEEELFPGDPQQYIEHFYQSDFKTTIYRRLGQLSEELLAIYEQNTGDSADPRVYQLLDTEFAGLLDQFIIQFCQDLHGFALPEAMLRYSAKEKGQVNLEQMIFAYLDFPSEQDPVYAKLDQIPEDKLRNAVQSFLLPGKEEKVFFICDISVFGSCKEGLAMTDQAIYWKAQLHPARQVFYTDLENLVRDNGDWITINDSFFNVNPLFNLKMFKLMRKLQEWYAATPP